MTLACDSLSDETTVAVDTAESGFRLQVNRSSRPSVNVIIPYYDRPKYLSRALDSILADARLAVPLAIEPIVVDDGSRNPASLLPLLQHRGVRVVFVPHRGGNPARNSGLQHVTADYLRFLDSDDVLIPGATRAQVECLERDQASVCYGPWCDIHESSPDRVPAVSFMKAENDMITTLLSNRWSSLFTYLYRTPIVKDVEWEDALTSAQDFDFSVKIAARAPRYTYVKTPIGYYQHHGGSASKHNILKWCDNMMSVLESAARRFISENNWSDRRRDACAQTMYMVSSNYYGVATERLLQAHNLIDELCPGRTPQLGKHGLLCRILGLRNYRRAIAWLSRRKERSTQA